MSLTLRAILLTLFLCTPLLSHASSATLFSSDFNVIARYASVPVSKQQAAGIAQQYVPGRVLKVTFDGSVYRVKIVSQSGDVVSVFVDGRTGEILN